MSIHRRPRNGTNQSHRRKGQALIEFAFVSIVMVTLFTVAFSLGLMLLQSMVTANAGASAGRILHHHPRLSPEAFAMRRLIDQDDPLYDYEYNLANPTASEIMRLITAQDDAFTTRFGEPLYDERLLILNRQQYDVAQADPESLPPINRLLLPNYIYDADRNVLRYPGAVVTRMSDGLPTVLVPLTGDIPSKWFDSGDCNECPTSTFWLPPVRIAKLSNVCDCNTDTMPPLSADGEFSITITFPAQAASLVEFRPVRDEFGEEIENEFGEVRERVLVNDSTLTQLEELPAGYALAPLAVADYNADFSSSSTRGDYGLGELEVLRPLDDDDPRRPEIRFEPINVRPYRRVIEHSSTFRLGQRFEAMYELHVGGTVSVQRPPMNEQPEPNSFRLTNKRFDDAGLFEGINEDPVVMAATIPVAGKWRINASANMRDSGFILPTIPPTTSPQPFLIQLLLFENNAATPSIVIAQVEASNDTPGPFHLDGSVVIEALEGDTVEVRVSHNHPDNRALTLEGSEGNWISLEAVFLRDQPRMQIPDPVP